MIAIAGYQSEENCRWREEQLPHALDQERMPQEPDRILAQSGQRVCIRGLDGVFAIVAYVAIIMGSLFWATRHRPGLTEMMTTGGIVMFVLLGVCGCWFIGRVTMWRIGQRKKISGNQSRNTASQRQRTSTLVSESPPPYIESSSFDYNPTIHGNIIQLPKLVYDRGASAWTQYFSTDRGYILFAGVPS